MEKWIGYQKGINLGGWLSQCDYSKDRFDNFIKEEDVARVATWGVDHVRVPVDYNLVETESGEYKEEGFAHIQDVIDWCGKYGLNMVLDLHKTYGYSFDPGEKEDGFFQNEKNQERFFLLWEQFAHRFAKYENRLAFELLNEVTEKEVSTLWNQIADKCIRRIRAIAPTIDILVGSYWNNSVESVPDMAMPQDAHVIYNFHCYAPLLFTHQGAYWVENMPADFRYAFGHTYAEYEEMTSQLLPQLGDNFRILDDPDKKLTGEYFKRLFANAVQTAEDRGTKLYCGEYGVIALATLSDTVEWYQAIHEAFEAYGIGRSAWCYKEMDFGLGDARYDSVREELIQYL